MMNLFTAIRPMRLWLFLALFGLAGPAWSGSANDFDFWLGQWNLTWGSDGQATNQVSRILDEQVILEQFDARPGDQLAGMSVTVYDAKADQWKQTWVDNTGAYLDFTGGLAPDGSMELFRPAQTAEGQPMLQRMVWYNIRPNSLDWNWERSTDGGASWQTVWKIHYERQPDGR
ncbi:MAG: hypothetical protein CMH65_02850 [Nevskiales bacterium]|nr:hypothetical protein [Nevskiales bacterium]